MHDIPDPVDPNTHLMPYIDDLTVMSQHPKYDAGVVKLQEYINQLETWLTKNRLKVSPNKSSLIVITSFIKKNCTTISQTLQHTHPCQPQAHSP